VPHQDRLNIAVFIDFDNIEIGVKSTLGEHFDVGTILEALKERGEVVTKIAYADWTRAGEYSRHLTQHAIRLVQRNLTPGGDKNGADINLALDALEMAFTHPHINAYVIVGGDSDFLSLVEKLKQYDKKVFVVGGRAFTSMILQRNCHEFIAYENLIRGRRSTSKGERPAVVNATTPVAQAIPIVRRALKILADREVTPQTGLLKSTLLQLDSTFSERSYGASSFLDFVEKLAKEGIVTIKTAGRSVMVELTDGYAGDGDGMGKAADAVETGAAPTAPPVRSEPAGQTPNIAHGAHGGHAAHTAQPAHAGLAQQGQAPVQATESAAAGVARASKILAEARNARWPMYLRNVKQILRQHREDGAGPNEPAGAGVFDERRYGFTGLMDLLKALQRDLFVRIERDRRGGLRVFQGSALQRQTHSVSMEGLPQVDPALEAEMAAAQAAGQTFEPEESTQSKRADRGEGDPGVNDDIEPMPIDTTAELLGRAKARKPRTSRLPRVVVAAGPKRASAKKPAARRSTHAKKTPSADANDDTQS
jgi:uncharacterized LabA/DUF88 family protein